MEVLLPLIFGLAIPVLMIVVLGGIGYFREQSHLRDLAEREQRLPKLAATSSEIAGFTATSMTLVVGNVVLGSDYLKQFTAGIRAMFGGEVVGFQRVFERAHREAYLRMMEQAVSQNAKGVVNVRFETSTLTSTTSEVFCYGTMVG